MRNIFTIPVRVYKAFISPVLTTYLGHSCRYSPTCSEYSIEAIKKYGVKGVILSVKRILRCNWKSTKYYDPVI